jgi:hypothetical protein
MILLKAHGFKGHRFGKVGIIFKLKILGAARRTFTEMPMTVSTEFKIIEKERTDEFI